MRRPRPSSPPSWPSGGRGSPTGTCRRSRPAPCLQGIASASPDQLNPLHDASVLDPRTSTGTAIDLAAFGRQLVANLRNPGVGADANPEADTADAELETFSGPGMIFAFFSVGFRLCLCWISIRPSGKSTKWLTCRRPPSVPRHRRRSRSGVFG